MNVRLPRLLDAQFHELCRLEPAALSLEMNLHPLSSAVMTLPPQSPAVTVGQFAELFTAQGSAGIFRVEQAEQQLGASTRVSLSHCLITLADQLYAAENTLGAFPAAQLFRDILSRQTLWTAGRADIPEDAVITLDTQGASLLDVLLSMMEQLPDYHLLPDCSTHPWTLHLLPLTDACLTECRLTRNLRQLTIHTDRSELCTQLYLPGIAQPLQADTIGQWGSVSRLLSASSKLTEQELTDRGRQYLEEHKQPLVTITLDAVDLCRLTGASMDSFHLGSLCRVCLPESGITLLQRMVVLSWPDVFGSPDTLRVTLATKSKNTSGVLASLIVDTTQVKTQTIRQWDVIADQKELIIAAEKRIALLSSQIDLHAADILTLRSGMEDNTAQITLMDGRISANASDIALKANRIELNGYVTATELETVRASISNLTSGLTTAMIINANTANVDQINGTFGSFDALNHNGALVSQRSITMGSVSSTGKALSTGGELDLQHSHAVTVNDDGTITLGEVSAEGGNFKIADTKAYKDGVSAAIQSVTVYSPAVTDTEHPGGSSKLMRVYMQAKASNGAASPVAHELISAAPVYDVGYSAGWAAAVAMLELSGNVIKGPSSTVGEQADLYTVTAGGSLNNITNTAANYFNVNGYAYAYINGTNVASKYIFKANQINVGQ